MLLKTPTRFEFGKVEQTFVIEELFHFQKTRILENILLLVDLVFDDIFPTLDTFSLSFHLKSQ